MKKLIVIIRHKSLNLFKSRELARVRQVVRLRLKNLLHRLLFILVNIAGQFRVFFKLLQEVSENRLRAHLQSSCREALFEDYLYQFLQYCFAVLVWLLISQQDLVLSSQDLQ